MPPLEQVHPPAPNPEFYAADRPHVKALAEHHGVQICDEIVLPGFRKLDGVDMVEKLARAIPKERGSAVQ